MRCSRNGAEQIGGTNREKAFPCRKVKIPDAIVAATAIHLSLPLVSRNIRDFSNIEGLSVINPFEDAPR
jgi:predicted nucleic acid-binding protein